MTSFEPKDLPTAKLHGYLLSAGLSAMSQDYLWQVTAEGDYIILALLTGKHISNFQKEYSELDELKLASFIETSLEDTAKKINNLITRDIENSENIVNYFTKNTKEFSKIMDLINKC